MLNYIVLAVLFLAALIATTLYVEGMYWKIVKSRPNGLFAALRIKHTPAAGKPEYWLDGQKVSVLMLPFVKVDIKKLDLMGCMMATDYYDAFDHIIPVTPFFQERLGLYERQLEEWARNEIPPDGGNPPQKPTAPYRRSVSHYVLSPKQLRAMQPKARRA